MEHAVQREQCSKRLQGRSADPPVAQRNQPRTPWDNPACPTKQPAAPAASAALAPPPAAVLNPRKIGSAPLAQDGRMRTPLCVAADWLLIQAACVWPGFRLVPSSCCVLIQPICRGERGGERGRGRAAAVGRLPGRERRRVAAKERPPAG